MLTTGAVGFALAGVLGGCAGGSGASSGGPGDSRSGELEALGLAEPEAVAEPVTPRPLETRIAEEARQPPARPQPQTQPQPQPEPEPEPIPARDAFAAPDWTSDVPEFPGRIALVASAEGERVRETRLAAIDRGLADLARRLGVEPGMEPRDARVERAAVLPAEGGGYRAYVLVTAPRP